ncbi:hypothetical protein R83H12_02036 [Fibrobacteria bacterium R8-3-H12]
MKTLLMIAAIVFLAACGPDTVPDFSTDTGQSSSSNSYIYYSSSSGTYYIPNCPAGQMPQGTACVPDPNYCPLGEQKITSNTFNDGNCSTESKAFADKWLGLCAANSFIDCVNKWKCQGGPAVSRTCGSL